MAAFTKQKLSGSTNGRGILVAASATLGTTIHTDGASATGFDEVYLWAWNSAASDELLTIEWGAVTDPNDIMEVTIPSQDGWYNIVPGFIIDGGLVVTAFSATGNVVTIQGFVNRIE